MAACSSLHAFRLDLNDAYRHGKRDPPHYLLTPRESLPYTFALGVEITALLNIGQLRHLSLQYLPNVYSHCGKPEDVRALDLCRLRDVCRRFDDLRSLDLVVRSGGKGDMVDIETAFSMYAREELRELCEDKRILSQGDSGSFFRCKESPCALRSGGTLNKINTLEHNLRSHCKELDVRY